MKIHHVNTNTKKLKKVDDSSTKSKIVESCTKLGLAIFTRPAKTTRTRHELNR
jgi:hypothetical protein